MRRNTQAPANIAPARKALTALRLSDEAEEAIRAGICVEVAYKQLGVASESSKKSQVPRLRRLQQLAPEVREMVESGKIISATLLQCIAGITPTEDQVTIARAYCSGRLAPRAIFTAMHMRASKGLRARVMGIAKKTEKS